MRKGRYGFTMTEMLMVLIIFGVVTALAVPKFNLLRNSGKLSAAKTHLMSSLTTARASAIQNGYGSRWLLNGNDVTVSARTAAGAYTALSAPASFVDRYGVTVAATQGEILFDPRGIATNLTSTNKIYVTGTTRDSVCVTRLGVVLRTGCL